MEWCMAHPWMTFIIILTVIIGLTSIIDDAIVFRGRKPAREEER